MDNIEFKCIHCKQILEAEPHEFDQLLECPNCRKTIIVPSPQKNSTEQDINFWKTAEKISVQKVNSNEKECPFCGETILLVAIKCKHCGSDLSLNRKKHTSSQSKPPQREGTFRSGFAGFMIIVGLLLACYFFFFFDTSVEVPTEHIFGQTIGGGRVNNLGLMNDRQNGIVFGFGMAIIGAVIELFARSRK